MKKTFILTIFFVSALFSNLAFAWNAVGHELVVQIAYDQLTPSEQIFWTKRINVLKLAYPKENFIRASMLPDELRHHDVTAFSTWHYIDLPILPTQQYSHQFIYPENILWALGQSVQVEKSRHSNAFEKAFFGGFLLHLVADVHQPLHCASLYNNHFPHGDRGGNLYRIKNKRWHNLHAYWDNGGGFLSKALIKNKNTLQKNAKMLEQQYPPNYFGARLNEKSFKVWAQESHNIAKDDVYSIPEYSAPSSAYQTKTQKITQEQIVLAGYRLAQLLKSLMT